MGYRIDDKKISLNRKNLHKISSDATGDTYCYRNKALKLFKQNKPLPIEEETTRYLTNISTSRILLPKNLVFYNNAFRGFTYKLMTNSKTRNKMIRLPKNHLIENISILEREVEVLSNKNVLFNGIEPKNVFQTEEIYIVAPTQFSILDSISNKELETLNKYQLHLLIISILTSELRKNHFSRKMEETVKELLSIKEETDNTSDFLEDLIGQEDCFEQFVKKIQ